MGTNNEDGEIICAICTFYKPLSKTSQILFTVITSFSWTFLILDIKRAEN